MTKKGFLALTMAGIMSFSWLALSGCTNSAPSTQPEGTIWFSGTELIETQGKKGDFFFDTDDFAIYQKNTDGWKLIGNIKEEQNSTCDYVVFDTTSGAIRWKYSKEPDSEYRTLVDLSTLSGENGIDGDSVLLRVNNGAIEWKLSKAEDSTYQTLITLQELKGADGKEVEFNFDGRYIEWKYKGEKTYTDLVDTQSWRGENGKSAYEIAKEAGFTGTQEEWLESLKGEKGISCYVGYDGYIWNGTERTEFLAGATLGANVIENTIGIEGEMSNYFKGGYVNLSSATIALMSNYMQNAKLTQYGNTNLLQIKVVAEKDGSLQIGTAKVTDVINARINGGSYTTKTTAYSVKKGLNVINLNIAVASDETVILGGKNSVGLYYAQGVNVVDEHGNFTLIDNKTHTDILNKTNGVLDTLAIQVSVSVNKESVQALANVQEKCPTDISTLTNYNKTSCPFKYQNTAYFAGKEIVEIGVPIKSLTDYTQNQVLTIFKVANTTLSNFSSNYIEKYELVIPANTYSSNTINAWHYFNINIKVGNNETLAFYASTDTVALGYSQLAIDSSLKFYLNSGTLCDYNIFIDVVCRNEGVQAIKDLEKKCPTDISGLVNYNVNTCPFAYANTTYFSNKQINKIGVPIKTLADCTKNQVLTIFKIPSYATSNFDKVYLDKYELIIPANTYSSNTVNAWHYFDVDIKVGENESLAFFNSTDTVMLGYSSNLIDNNLKFCVNNGASYAFNIFIDVIYEPSYIGQHILNLKNKENLAMEKAQQQELANVLSGKNFSILGDSISTFNGYSNDSTNTNSTIGSNAVWYDTELQVTDTWWKQISELTNMKVLVDNAFSGDTIANAKNSRCVNLHDNTGANAGTNPDIIAFYMGVNDIKNDANLSVETFKANYLTIVEKMMATYKNADIFVFTIPQYNYASPRTDEELNAYNNAIREIAQSKGLGLVDLFANSGIIKGNLSLYTIDNLHPNAIGMDLITNCFWKVLYNTYVTGNK